MSDIEGSLDQENILAQQHIPGIVFFSYLASLILSRSLGELQCQQKTPRCITPFYYLTNQKLQFLGFEGPKDENNQIMQCNSCIKVTITECPGPQPCQVEPRVETRIKCPVYKLKHSFGAAPGPKVCSCDNPNPGIGDVCSNGEPTPWYTERDFDITEDEDGYCLGNDGYLDPRLKCDIKDRRAPFKDYPDCTEASLDCKVIEPSLMDEWVRQCGPDCVSVVVTTDVVNVDVHCTEALGFGIFLSTATASVGTSLLAPVASLLGLGAVGAAGMMNTCLAPLYCQNSRGQCCLVRLRARGRSQCPNRC